MAKRKRIPVVGPGQSVTIHGSGSFKLAPKCDVDVLGVSEEVAQEECKCPRHATHRNAVQAGLRVLNKELRRMFRG